MLALALARKIGGHQMLPGSLVSELLDTEVPWYQDTKMTKTIERVQTGVRLEKRLLKVLKGLAEYLDMSLGDLLEGMALHCFEGRPPPFSKETLTKIEQLKDVYDLDLRASDSHHLKERKRKP